MSDLNKDQGPSNRIKNNTLNYPIYKTDLRYRKNRKIYREIDKNDPIYKYTKINMDSLKYRFEECYKTNGESLDLSGLELKKFPDLKYIPKNIKYLFCSDNELREIPDLSRFQNLEIFGCDSNKLMTLPKMHKVIEICCSNNRIQNLDDVGINRYLKRLDCSNNFIEKIPEIYSLESLICNNNNLRSISSMSKLVKLYCYTNKIKELGKFPKIELLDCRDNRITKLPIYKSLIELYCNNNKIKNLKHGYDNLEILHCYENLIDTIRYFGDKVKEIICDYERVIRIGKKYNIKRTTLHKKKHLFLEFSLNN